MALSTRDLTLKLMSSRDIFHTKTVASMQKKNVKKSHVRITCMSQRRELSLLRRNQ